MKNLSRKSRRRQWHRIHRHHLDRRRRKRRRQGKRATPNIKVERSFQKLIECPSEFSLDTNFEGVINILQAIRAQSQRQRNESLYVDFRPIKELSPAAALVLAAELDRWNHVLWRQGKGDRLQARAVEEWDPMVRRLLGNMGFFELLRAVNPIVEENDNTETRYVQFRTGHQADGEAIVRLREDDLEPLVGKVPSEHHLYGAVIEAMTNVVHHAYSSQTIRQNWWLSASYNAPNSEIAIMIFDQGVGIPATLRRRFSELVKRFAITDHAQMIEAAHDLSRSASEQSNRGNGLGTDMRAYLKRLDCHGSYCVTSLRGRYIFEKQVNGETSEHLKNHKQALNGTLIEWRLRLP